MKATRIDKNRFGPWAIVTGASSGIGKEFARQVAANGINVVLLARRGNLLEELGQQLTNRFGVEYRAVTADLAKEDSLGPIRMVTDDLDVGLVISNAGHHCQANSRLCRWTCFCGKSGLTSLFLWS
jgi:uncharacterized protein